MLCTVCLRYDSGGYHAGKDRCKVTITIIEVITLEAS